MDKYGADDIIEYHNNNIVREEDDTNTHYIPISTKAYKLFSEGKTPLQVSITLNLRAPEVQILYKEYWELRRMHSLVRIYDELGDRGISNFLRLHQSCKEQRIGNEQIVEYLTIYGNDLSMVKREYDAVDTRLRIMLSQIAQTEKELQDLHTAIGFSSDMLKATETDCEIAKKERNNLAIQKLSLLRFVSDFKDKNKNDVYMRLERFVQHKVNTILSNNNSTLNSYNKNDLQYHTQKQKPGDYCYACYSSGAEVISKKYFENLGKEMISEIGLDSVEGIYAASHYAHFDHQHQYG